MARAYWRSGVACNTSAPRCVVGSLLVESQRIGVIVMDKLRLVSGRLHYKDCGVSGGLVE